MLTKAEELQNKIDELKVKSRSLKIIHKHGNWDNWRKFINYDIQINELTIELLQLENEQLNESLITYSDY